MSDYDWYNNKQDIKGWWDEQHSKNDFGMLTGSIGKNVWTNLSIMDRIKKGVKVLNIGIGLGYCTKELCETGCEVDVLDISETAIERVKDITKHSYLAANIKELPNDYYDIAISHLVAQHMSDEDLKIQLKEVIRSLKPDCQKVELNKVIDPPIFAIQIAGMLIGGSSLDDLLHQKGGGVCRSLSKMATMVEEAGGNIIMAQRFGVYMQFKSYGYYLHITKAVK